MKKLYIVDLNSEERQFLHKLVNQGHSSARKQKRARILLKADVNSPEGGCTDKEITQALDVGRATVERVRKSFVERGVKATLVPKSRPRPKQRVLDGHKEAQLLALACSEPPDGYCRWSLHLLKGEMVRLEYVETISHETIRQALKKTPSNLT